MHACMKYGMLCIRYTMTCTRNMVGRACATENRLETVQMADKASAGIRRQITHAAAAQVRSLCAMMTPLAPLTCPLPVKGNGRQVNRAKQDSNDQVLLPPTSNFRCARPTPPNSLPHWQAHCR